MRSTSFFYTLRSILEYSHKNVNFTKVSTMPLCVCVCIVTYLVYFIYKNTQYKSVNKIKFTASEVSIFPRVKIVMLPFPNKALEA